MTRTPARRTATRRRKSRHTVSPEERAERLSAARQQLLDGVDGLMTAEGWHQLITSRAWLRRYSLNNLIMILQQCPEATDVRPLSEWKQEGYGYLRKGTHKIKIWKPRFRTRDPEQTDNSNSTTSNSTTSNSTTSSAATSSAATSAEATTSTDQTARTTALSGFLLVPVVDVSQLQGDPPTSRPAPPRPVELAGDAPAGLWDGIAAQITARGYRMERGDCDGAYGRTIWRERRVIVRADVDPAQAAKTLTHELAHILCEHETRADTPRHLREVEAESVACIVAAVCGLDTLAYSVPYVAGWAADRDTARQSAQRVLTVADAILSRLDQAPPQTTSTDTETSAEISADVKATTTAACRAVHAAVA